MRIEFRILGPLEVSGDGRVVPLGSPKQRALLALLLVHANETLSRDRLIEELWGDAAPPSVESAFHVYLSRLRRLVESAGGNGLLVRQAHGYRLRVEPDQLDASLFGRLAREGREALAAGEAECAADRLREALALWRGPALADLESERFAIAAAARLEEERVSALEQRLEADLALARHCELVGELETLVAEHPYRERLRAQLMLALYRSGRQAEALRAYQQARRTLADELGLEPGSELRELEQAILRQEPTLTLDPNRELQDPENAILTHDARRNAAPVARLSETKLPIQPTSFLGRERELTEVLALLRREHVRLLTLTGTGGSGKTRLALQAAAELADEYEDGVWWVPLAGLGDPQLVLETVAQALGVTDELGRELASKRLLLLLDNFEHLAAAAPGLARLLALCPNVDALVTSRERLHLAAEHEYSVSPLAEEEAIALFQARASVAVSNFNADDVLAKICRWLDCLPLAVELAAARVKVLPPEKILDRIEKRLLFLTGGPRDAPERHRTLRATIEWSHDLLDEEERVLFGRLAVFAGGCTVESAEQVAEATLDTLESLVEKNLLRTEGGRFSMLETIREYALERLDESGEAEEVRRRHARHFLALAERAESEWGGRQSEWIHRLEADHDNLRAALTSARASGDVELELRLVGALWNFWAIRGFLAEGRLWSEDALTRSCGQPSDLHAKVLFVASALASLQGEVDHATRLGEERLALARANGDTRSVADSLVFLGTLAFQIADYDRARSLYENALELYRQLDIPERAAVALEDLAEVAVCQRQFSRAASYLEECTALFRAAKNQGGLAHSHLIQGQLALQAGRPEDAPPAFADGIRLFHTLMHRAQVAIGLHGLAAASVSLGDCERAARLLGAAEHLLEETGASLSPFEQQIHEPTLAAVRRDLDENRLEAMWAEGRAMPLDAAVEYALRTPTTSDAVVGLTAPVPTPRG